MVRNKKTWFISFCKERRSFKYSNTVISSTPLPFHAVTLSKCNGVESPPLLLTTTIVYLFKTQQIFYDQYALFNNMNYKTDDYLFIYKWYNYIRLHRTMNVIRWCQRDGSCQLLKCWWHTTSNTTSGKMEMQIQTETIAINLAEVIVPTHTNRGTKYKFTITKYLTIHID